jgi:hypothetical protein
MLLFSRLMVSSVPAWQLAAGVGLLVGAILLGLAGAARIYRTAMLHQGRRPGLRELATWMRRAG